MLHGSAARKGYASVFQLSNAWPLTDGRFAEECGRVLALSSAHARCLPSATVVDRYGVPLSSAENKALASVFAQAQSLVSACCPPSIRRRTNWMPERRSVPRHSLLIK